MVNIGMRSHNVEEFYQHGINSSFDASTSLPQQEEILSAFEDVLVNFFCYIYCNLKEK